MPVNISKNIYLTDFGIKGRVNIPVQCGIDICMSKYFTQTFWVHSALNTIRGECVAERVKMFSFDR